MHTTVEREVRVCDPCFNLYGPKEEAGARPAAQQQKKPLWLELVSKELNHLAAILHVYAGGLNF